MKNLLIVLSVLALSVSAMAYPGSDSIGIYIDGNADTVVDADLSYQTPGVYSEVELFLCITNPTSTSVSGWEAVIENVGTSLTGIWTLTAGLDADGDLERFSVGIGTGAKALSPNENGAVILAKWNGLFAATSDPMEFFIKRIPDSQGFTDTPGYADGDNEALLVPLFTSTGGPDIPVFCVNVPTCSLVGNSDQTWSGVKNMFR
jgi:hypothetical protein